MQDATTPPGTPVSGREARNNVKRLTGFEAEDQILISFEECRCILRYLLPWARELRRRSDGFHVSSRGHFSQLQ